MRALIGRIGFVVALAVGLLGSTAKAQFRDTLQVGDRVRVRVAATRGTTNLFVGNLASVSPETLVVEIPGGKGSIILPRAAVAEVALSQGNESRWRRVPATLPYVVPAYVFATLPAPRGEHANGVRNLQYLFGALSVLQVASIVGRSPREKWEPVYRWLERR
jgi:hypothetical protein